MAEHLISIEHAQKDLLACATYLAEGIKSREGHAQALLLIVPRYLENGDVDLSAELANSIDDPFSRDRLLIRVAEKCARIDDDEYALQLVEAIEDYGLQSQARERIALIMAGRGDFDKAREVADELDHRDSVFAGIAIKQASEGNHVEALNTIGEINFPGTAVHALTTISATRFESNEIEPALELMEKASLAAGEIEHSEEKIRALSEIGNRFLEANRSDKAIEAFDRARVSAEALDNVHRDAFLSGVSLGFMRAGSVELADRTLDSVGDKTQIATTLLGFAREFWRKDERTEAFEALEEAYAMLKSQREAETRDSKAKFSLFTSIAVQFAGFEKGERAIGIAQEIVDGNEQMSALGRIARVLTIQGRGELADQAMQAIPEDSSRMFALISVSDTHEENNDREKAGAFLEQAAALAETVPQPASRTAAYIELANRYLKYENKDAAREISTKNLETIASIRDESTRAVELANLSEIYKTGEFDLSERESEVLRSLLIGRSF